MANFPDDHSQRTQIAWLNYSFTALDFLLPPKCKKCHQKMKWAATKSGNIELAFSQVKDVATGFPPKFICVNTQVPIKARDYLTNPMLFVLRKKIKPCDNNYHYKLNSFGKFVKRPDHPNPVQKKWLNFF